MPDPFSFTGQAAFEVLAAAIADAVIVVEPRGDVAYVDAGLLDRLGLAEGEVVGRPLLALVHPDDAVHDEAGGFWAAPLPFEREFRMRTADGAWAWVTAQSTATDARGGRPEAVAQALGARTLLLVRPRDREGMPRDARDVFQRALDAADHLVVVSDARRPDEPLVYVNQAFLDVTGYAREDVLGHNCRFLQTRPDGTRDTDGDGQGEALAAVRAAMASGEPVEVVLRNYTRDGRLFYNRLSLNPLRGAAGAVTHVVGVQRDITAGLARERQAEGQRHLLAAAVEHAAEAIVVTDTETRGAGPRILYANRAHERIFGYDLDEIVGSSPRMFQGPKTDRGVLDRIARALAAGESVEAETINYRKDGAEFVLQWEIAPVTDAEGHVVNWVGTQRDVTERRQLETEVLEASAREQERLARDLHDGLGQVLTGAAFRLQALRQALAGLGRDDLAEDANRTRQIVNAAHEQARAIAHGLAPVAVELDGLMVALERLAADAGTAYDIRCAFVAEGAVAVSSSEQAGHLYRIVQEAIANAARHGRARTITISMVRGADGVTLAVEDDGRGIAPERIEAARGLGLRTMTYRADRVGGSLEIGPRDGGGTRVALTFRPTE